MSENRGVLERPVPPPDLTTSYGPGPDQVVDIWLPETGASPAPVWVLWHGGYWRNMFDRRTFAHVAVEMAGEGFIAVNAEYRRVGEGGGWPNTFVDVAAVADGLSDLLTAALPWRADLSRVFYGGHSAGGQLALWAASRHLLPAGAPGRRTDPPAVAGVVALAPVSDVGSAYRAALDENAAGDFLGGGPVEWPDRYAAADPMALAAPDVPISVVHGDRDTRVPIEMSRRYRDHTACRLVELPGADHFDIIDPQSPRWPTIRSEFLAAASGS